MAGAIRGPAVEQDPGTVVWTGDNILPPGPDNARSQVGCEEGFFGFDVRAENMICNSIAGGVTPIVIDVCRIK